jgi:predicted amidohydrolase YtcJ
MASFSQPKELTFKADAAIAKGKAVTIGSDSNHVAVASDAADKMVGIVQASASAAEDLVEVALPGGGAKALVGGNVAAGDLLTTNADGELIATTTATDRYIAMALESGVDGDLIAVEVVAGLI